MKKLAAFFAVLFILFIIYHDIKIGTLPVANGETITNEQKQPPQESSIPFQKIEVHAGDTVLSVVESINEGQSVSSIENIIKDFETLNPGTKAGLLKIGKTYLFPVYQ